MFVVVNLEYKSSQSWVSPLGTSDWREKDRGPWRLEICINSHDLMDFNRLGEMLFHEASRLIQVLTHLSLTRMFPGACRKRACVSFLLNLQSQCSVWGLLMEQ